MLETSAGSLGIGASIYTSISTAQVTLRAAVERCAARLLPPVTADEYAALRLLRRFPDLDLNAFSDLLVLQRASARQLLVKLADKGLVSVTRKENDRRVMDTAITASGHAVLAEAEKLSADSSFSRALDQLAHAERRLLGDELDMLRIAVCADLTSKVLTDSSGRGFAEAWEQGTSFIALHELWFSLVRIYRCVRAEQTRFLSSSSNHQLDTGTYMALYRVHESPCSLSEVAAFLRVDQNTAIKILDRLEANGLIARDRNPNNRRQALISANDKGLQLLNAIPPIDPNGAYLAVVRSLAEGGSVLAERLRALLNTVLQKPIVNEALFSGLIRRLQQVTATAHTDVASSDYRKAMSWFLTGVVVVSVPDNEAPRGVTVNSLTSVSLDPPILLICFDRRSASLRLLRDAGRFGVNILSSEQQEIAARFGKRESSENSHAIAPESWREVRGVPIIAESLTSIVCEVAQTYEAGTHTIVLAEPREIIAPAAAAESTRALGYWQSRYVSVSRQAAADERDGQGSTADYAAVNERSPTPKTKSPPPARRKKAGDAPTTPRAGSGGSRPRHCSR